MKKAIIIGASSGIGDINHELDWKIEKDTIDVNVSGVTSMINVSLKYFTQKKSGHLVVISSIAALRGGSDSPVYSASKAYISNYLEGIRCKVKKDNLNITITDIRPGLVNTEMAKGNGLFWIQPVKKVAHQIYTMIRKKKDVGYVTKRWRIIAFLMKRTPDCFFYKL